MTSFILISLSICCIILQQCNAAAVKDTSLDDQWQEYKIKYKKVYTSSEDEALRKEIFKLNMEKINEHNEKYRKNEVTWEMGVNQFTDMTVEEFGNKLTSKITDENVTSLNKQWLDFKLKYNKSYSTAEEEKFRKEIFRINLEKINEHNEKFTKQEVSFGMGINEFTDMTFEEFRRSSGASVSGILQRTMTRTKTRQIKKSKPLEKTELPSDVNWVKYGFNTTVWHQGRCGSCYAMAVTAAIESHWFIKHNQLITLSQQELIDCSFSYGNMGCQYGDLNNSFKYVVENGVGTFMKYPYIQKVNECKRTTTEEDIRYNITKWVQTVEEDEEDLKHAVANGPVIAVINTGLQSFIHYKGGVYYDEKCRIDPLSVNHFVLVVGYGTTEEGKDYWLIKNSFGYFWGMKGYMHLARNRSNQCGIATEAMYPVLG